MSISNYHNTSILYGRVLITNARYLHQKGRSPVPAKQGMPPSANSHQIPGNGTGQATFHATQQATFPLTRSPCPDWDFGMWAMGAGLTDWLRLQSSRPEPVHTFILAMSQYSRIEPVLTDHFYRNNFHDI